MEFSFLPFFIDALGYNRQVYSGLDRLFKKDPQRFYSLAKNHPLYNHPIVREGDLLREIYTKRALGLVLASEDDEDIARDLFSVIADAWKPVYLYVNNHSPVSFEGLLQYLVRKKGGLSEIWDDEVNCALVIAYFFAINLEKEVEKDKAWDTFVNALSKRASFLGGELPRFSLNLATEEDLVRLNAMSRKIKGVDNFLSFLDTWRELAEIPGFLFDLDYLSSLSVFEQVPFSLRDMREVLFCYLVSEKVIEKYSRFELCFCFMLYLRYMIKAYMIVKEQYFANNQDTLILDFELLEKRVAELEKTLSVSENLLVKAREANVALEREVKRLKADAEAFEKDRAELYALREFLFRFDREAELAEETAEVDLSNVKAVVLGGHSRWQSRMKSLLPGFVFIPPDSDRFDTSLVKNADFVFVYANYLRHKIYYRAIQAVDRAKIYFLSQQNEDLVLNEIRKVVSAASN